MVTLNSRVRLTNLWPLNSRLNWNLEMLVFEEGGKPEDSEKKPGMRMRTDNKLNSHVTPKSGNQTWATLVGGDSSHHCTIPAPTICDHVM